MKTLTLAILLATGLMAEERGSVKPTAEMLKYTPKATISPTDKLRLREAQLRTQEAVTALLQSPAYAALQIAQSNTASVVTDIERVAGCKIDTATADCALPPKEAAKTPNPPNPPK